jgi:hypothetical protein
MRICAAILAVAILPAAAHAQPEPAPLVAGARVESFEAGPDRTVIFAPTADGKIRIVTSTQANRLAPMLRHPGKVAVSLSVARVIGAVIAFGSGRDHGFVCEAGAGDMRIATCPVRDNRLAADQWPQGYRSIVIGPRTRVGRTTPCERGD